jgi:endoglucanase
MIIFIQIQLYASKGFGIIRLPFDLRRVYHFPYSPLSSFEMEYMIPVVDYCLSKGMRVIIDPHNYGFIYDNRTGDTREIGVDQEGTNMFVDFWSRMATVFKDYSNVVFGLMNEPYNQTAAQWYEGAVPAIKVIRAVGATQLILIPGTSWTGAHSWNSSGNAEVWTGFNGDPLNNFAFEMHQYLDINSGGSHDACVANSSSRLLFATSWLNANKCKGFLAEFAYTVDPTCVHEAPLFLDFLSLNSNVWMGWTYWCGGLLFSKTNRFILDPVSFLPPIVDRPQMAELVAHI